MAGLGAAYKLSSEGDAHIVLFETSPSLGGLSMALKMGTTKLEPFYHHMFPNYKDIMKVSEEIGAEGKIFFKKAKSGIYRNAQMHPFDSPFDLLKFQPLNIFDRIRTGIVLALLKSAKSVKRFEGVSAESWLKKKFGREAFSVLWEPLLRSKFGRFWGEVGMNWFWGRIYERPTKFGYFRGSLASFIDPLEKHLEGKGVDIRTGNPVVSIDRLASGKFEVVTKRGKESFDQLIIAAAPEPFLAMAGSLLPDRFKEELAEYKYLGAICAVMILDRPLTDYYWLNINDPDFPFLGIIEQSNFVDPKEYAGNHPVYLSKYLESDSSFFSLDDNSIWEAYIPWIKKVRPEFDPSWIKERYVFRAKFAQPVITSKYSDILPKYKTPIPGLWWVSMSHVYPWDRGMDHAFRAGIDLANSLKQFKNG